MTDTIRLWVISSIFSLAVADMWSDIYLDNGIVEESNGERQWIIRIVYIPPDVFDQHETEQYRVIAHEIAHHWLRHRGAVPTEEFKEREREVETLIRQWGFS